MPSNWPPASALVSERRAQRIDRGRAIHDEQHVDAIDRRRRPYLVEHAGRLDRGLHGRVAAEHQRADGDQRVTHSTVTRFCVLGGSASPRSIVNCSSSPHMFWFGVARQHGVGLPSAHAPYAPPRSEAWQSAWMPGVADPRRADRRTGTATEAAGRVGHACVREHEVGEVAVAQRREARPGEALEPRARRAAAGRIGPGDRDHDVVGIVLETAEKRRVVGELAGRGIIVRGQDHDRELRVGPQEAFVVHVAGERRAQRLQRLVLGRAGHADVGETSRAGANAPG